MSIIQLDKLHYAKALLFALLAAPPILGLYFMVLRAPIALIGFCALILLVKFYKKWIFVASLLLMVFIASGIYKAGSVTNVFDSFIQKQSQFGDNSKLEELSAATNLVLKDDISTVFAGYGWGATWLSPAVGVKVRYAHSLITFIILKMGLIGICVLIPFILYLIILGIRLFITIKKPEDCAVLLAIFPVFVVNIFLESGYKTLDFGIILLLFFILNNLQKTTNHATP